MNPRDFGFVILKLLGLSYMFDALYHFANLLTFQFGPVMEGDSSRSIALSSCHRTHKSGH